MSDFTPKSVASSPGVSPGLAASAMPAASHTATAAEIPAAVANLSIGTVVTGTVIERSPRGLVVLRTDKGTIKLQTSVPLKQGSTVTLQIQSVGAQVQLLILSIDGQPLAHAPVKHPSTRLDNATKSPVGDHATNRQQASSANATSASPANPDEQDATSARAAPSDRLAADRGAQAGGRPAPTATPAAPAGGFVARPLAQINSVSLEALSSPPAVAPGAASAIVRPSTILPAPAAGIPPSGGQIPHAASSSGGPMVATAPITEAPTESAVIAPGTRFTATVISAPPAVMAESGDPAAPRAQPSAPLPLPSTTGSLTAAMSLTPPALPSDRVILRLLGMAATPSPTPMGAATVNPGIAPGVIATADALTMIGTIAEDSEIANVPPSSATAANGKTLIATPFGLLAAAGPPPGPVGTKLLLELIAPGETLEPRPPLAGSSPSPIMASANSADKSWPALRGIMAALQSVAPGAAEHLSNVTLPQIGPNLAAGLMVFVAALRQGNPRAWLGEQTVDILQRTGQGALIDKLGDELATVTRLASETNPQGWQTLLMPLYDGGQLQQIRMYWQHQQRKSNQRKDGTRFVIEADLTTLGMLQLDGVFNKPQFDLVVRTNTSLPASIRGDIIEIFGDALLATSLKGAVSFQTKADLRAGAPAGEDEFGKGLIV